MGELRILFPLGDEEGVSESVPGLVLLEVQQPYNRLAEGTGLSGRDMFTRSYLSGLYRYPTP